MNKNKTEQHVEEIVKLMIDICDKKKKEIINYGGKVDDKVNPIFFMTSVLGKIIHELSKTIVCEHLSSKREQIESQIHIIAVIAEEQINFLERELILEEINGMEKTNEQK